MCLPFYFPKEKFFVKKSFETLSIRSDSTLSHSVVGHCGPFLYKEALVYGGSGLVESDQGAIALALTYKVGPPDTSK